MNDLDDLKLAMQSPPDYTPSELDLSEIMRVGGQVRRRRRLIAGSTAAAAVVVLLVGGSQLIDTGNDPGRGTPIAPGAAASPTAPAPTAGASPEPTPPFEAPDEPLGTVIRTGLPAKGGEWVFYGVAVDVPTLPNTRFGIMLGVRQHNGDIRSSVVINETEGPDRAPGFHTGEGSMNVDGGTTPPFGYFVGEAYKITATVNGKPVKAGLQRWSKDPSVVVYWFDPAKVGPGAKLTRVVAYDRLGKKLSSGETHFGVG
jgi:hypothetical protein